VGRLEGKVVFLTGAGAGIAKATAKMCVREGAGVLEQIAVGPHAPSGFRETYDLAP
jgi:NAD(P)-dependent dehydrogenase (short-subunit alcohol dehydrogenase family)